MRDLDIAIIVSLIAIIIIDGIKIYSIEKTVHKNSKLIEVMMLDLLKRNEGKIKVVKPEEIIDELLK